MSDRRGVTRRTVLAGAAAAGAARLIAPAGALAETLPRPDPHLSSLWLGATGLGTGQLAAPWPFALAGVQWSGPEHVRIELRARLRDGRWTEWLRASASGHGPDRPARAAPLFGDPVWTGPADLVQLRSSRPLRGVRIHFVSAGAEPQAGLAGAPALAQPVLNAGPGQPPIIAREAWSSGARPAVPPGYGTVKLAFVHHTENANGYGAAEVPAMLLAIYRFHRFVRGWDDIGYNFVIDRFGRIWEARQGGIAQPVIGAQAGGYNKVSTGVAVLGSFTAVVPPPAAIDALERLLAWKLSLHGVPTTGRVRVRVPPAEAFYTPFKPGARVWLPRVAGHRDGDATSCPGNAFYARLPAIRPRITRLAGSPLALRIAPPAHAPLTAPASIVVAGTLNSLGGPPLAGARVQLQKLTAGGQAIPLGDLTTGADGGWSFPLELTANAALQAIHAPAPAAVSDVEEVAVAPRIEARVISRAPLRVAGTVFPAKRRVTVEVYSLAHGHRRVVARKQVPVRQGRFSVTIPPRGQAPREVIVRTPADAASAAGSSPPIPV